jgi:hypothetical protein
MIALHKNVKFGLKINLLLITGFALLSAIITFIYDFAPGFVNTGREYEIRKKQISIFNKLNKNCCIFISDYYYKTWVYYIYWKPLPHGSTYFIGIFFGYIFHEIKPKNLSNVKNYYLVHFK